MVDPVDGMEKLWIVGGVTQNCAVDARHTCGLHPGECVGWYVDGCVLGRRCESAAKTRCAKAVTLPTSNATSMMVSGGSFDASTCAATNGTYAGIDMWTPSTLSSNPASTANLGIDTTAITYASISSLALDPRMEDLPLTDYTTALLPATPTCGSKILFLGGKSSSSLRPLTASGRSTLLWGFRTVERYRSHPLRSPWPHFRRHT